MEVLDNEILYEISKYISYYEIKSLLTTSKSMLLYKDKSLFWYVFRHKYNYIYTKLYTYYYNYMYGLKVLDNFGFWGGTEQFIDYLNVIKCDLAYILYLDHIYEHILLYEDGRKFTSNNIYKILLISKNINNITTINYITNKYIKK